MLPALTGIPWKTPHVRFWEGENRVLGGGCCTRRSSEGRVSKAWAGRGRLSGAAWKVNLGLKTQQASITH